MSGFDFRVFPVWQILGFTQPFLASTSCLTMECFRICMLLGHFQELKERTAHDFIRCVFFLSPWETGVPSSVLPLLLTLDCSPASSCSLQWQMLWLSKWQWELGPLPVILFFLKFDAGSHSYSSVCLFVCVKEMFPVVRIYMTMADSSCLEMIFSQFIFLVEKPSCSESWTLKAIAVCAESLAGRFPGTTVFMRYMAQEWFIHNFPHVSHVSKNIAPFSGWPYSWSPKYMKFYKYRFVEVISA